MALAVSVACAGLSRVAQAADRPAHPPGPIAYARICDASGAGYFSIPGSGRCLRSGGFVPGKIAGQGIFPSISGSLPGIGDIADSANGKGNFAAGGLVLLPDRRGFGASEMPIFSTAYIQFACLTAGQARLMLDTGACPNDGENLGSGAIAAWLTYTARSGDGYAAQLSLEGSLTGTSSGRIVAPAEVPTGVDGETSQREKPARMSEIVGNLRLDQPWGEINVPGAAHSEPATLATIAPFPTPAGSTPPYDVPALTNSSSGFTAPGGMQMNLDYLSPGDKLWLQAAYEKTAVGYDAGNANGSVSQNPAPGSHSAPESAGWNPRIMFNCVFAASSKCEQQSSWDITGAYKNNWLPILNSPAKASTLEVRNQTEAPGGLGAPAGGASVDQARIEPSLFQSPLRGFDIGAEYMYARVSHTGPAGPALENEIPATGAAAFGPSTGIYEGRLHVQRGY